MSTGRPLNVCIVTADVVGPVRNGGIGTWYHALATALAAAGHRVTVLYTLGDWCENKSLEHWAGYYAERGVDFIPLPKYQGPLIDAAKWVSTSFEICEWLRAKESAGRAFDVIHFHEWRGHGFYPTLAKRQGLAFANAVLCVGTHSPLLWHKFGMAEFLTELHELETDFLERQSVALADVVVSPSRYMLKWITEQGWKLPGRVEVRQYIQSHHLPSESFATMTRRDVREIVFFGRLETRKGITLFCDAVDRLAAQPSRLRGVELKITFLGKKSEVNGVATQAYLDLRAGRWPFAWSIVDTLDHAGAIEFLTEPGRLAVIASLLENSPNTVLECLVNQVPCLCTDIGGNPELVAEEDRRRVTFPPRADALAEKIFAAVESGFVPARPATPPEQTRREWLDWHERIVAEVRPPAPVVDAEPLVSVCIAHRNRPHLLSQALESVRRQDYPKIEVVLVDDGSTDEAALSYLDELEVEFAPKGWKIVRQENRYLGAARNNAARNARGEYLLFMDDDNVAKPREVSTFVRAARYSGADVLTCTSDVFHGEDAPTEGNPLVRRWVPLGGAVNVGVFQNLMGDANALVKRSTFDALGGFTEDYGVGHEDWELFAKAALNGYVVQVVPETLFWYRVGASSMLRTTNGFANHMRSLRPYVSAAPQLRTTLEYTQSLYMLLARRTAEAAVLCDRAAVAEAWATKQSDEARRNADDADAAREAARAAECRAHAAEARADAAESRGGAPETHSAETHPAEARAGYVRVHVNGEANGYQRVVDDHWDSLSWRLSAPLRNALLRARGRPPSPRPVVRSRVEADHVVNSIRSSLSWEAAGVFRAVGRVVNKLLPKGKGDGGREG